MTILTPFLLALALGVVEVGRALHHYHAVNKSVRDAARFLARVPITCTSTTTCTLTNATDATRAQRLARTGDPDAGGTPILSYWTSDSTVTIELSGVDNTGGGYYGKSYMPVVRVRAAVPFTDLGTLSLLGISPITLRAQHEQLHIGE